MYGFHLVYCCSFEIFDLNMGFEFVGGYEECRRYRSHLATFIQCRRQRHLLQVAGF